MGGPRPGARTQPVAGPSRPGIFHRLPAGQTEVTRAWGGVVRPRPALGARDPRPSTSESVAPLQPSAAGPSPVRVCGPLSSHLLPALLLPRPCPSLRPPSSHLLLALLLCPQPPSIARGLSRPPWSLRPPWSTVTAPSC